MTSKSILLLLFLSGPLFGGSGKKKQNKESEPNNPTKPEGSAWHTLDDIFEVYIWSEEEYQPLKDVAAGYEGHVTGLLNTLLSIDIDGYKEGAYYPLPANYMNKKKASIYIHDKEATPTGCHAEESWALNRHWGDDHFQEISLVGGSSDIREIMKSLNENRDELKKLGV